MGKYIKENYGTCSALRCTCRIEGPWLGTACLNWKPADARDFLQLAEWQFSGLTSGK